MEIRLTGTPEETDRAARALRAVLEIRSLSRFYPNRGATRLGRVYLDADAPHLIPTAPAHTTQRQEA